ncbi:hypothetical protein [Streptomyces sp. NPDC004629]|uniref:hypothetical protein n=1 Tax=Streptomyces sp. NPDC004629 TaxID=3364705 RepID=UPI0036CCB3E0
MPSPIATLPPERDPDLATLAREHILRTITTLGEGRPEPPEGVASRVPARLGSASTVLTRSGRAPLGDRLDRIADTGEPGPAARETPGRRDGCDAHM